MRADVLRRCAGRCLSGAILTGIWAGMAACCTAQAPAGQDGRTPGRDIPDRSPGAATAEERADLLVIRHQYMEAIGLYESEPTLSPTLLNKLGVAYEHMRLYPQARLDFERAIAMDPKLKGAENNLGTVFFVQGDLRRAEQHYRRALKSDPRNASIYNNLGTLYFARHKVHKGIEAYQQALSLDSGIFERTALTGIQAEGSAEERALINYYLAQTCAQSGMQTAALRYLRQAIAAGFHDVAKLRDDGHFAAMRSLPEFEALMLDMADKPVVAAVARPAP